MATLLRLDNDSTAANTRLTHFPRILCYFNVCIVRPKVSENTFGGRFRDKLQGQRCGRLLLFTRGGKMVPRLNERGLWLS